MLVPLVPALWAVLALRVRAQQPAGALSAGAGGALRIYDDDANQISYSPPSAWEHMQDGHDGSTPAGYYGGFVTHTTGNSRFAFRVDASVADVYLLTCACPA